MLTPSNLFSFLLKILSSLSEKFRMFVAGSIIGIYSLVLYKMFPELLFDINYSISYFVIPVSVIASIMIVLPKLMIKNKPNVQSKAPANDTDSLLNELITEPSQQSTQDTTVSPREEKIDVSAIGGTNSELDALLAGTNLTSDTITTDQISVTPVMTGFDENKIRELIDQKFEPVEKDLTTFKKDLNKIKEDMKITKESVDTLTESFEGTLTDMKAFQAEISNPLNFMRKYFEALDLSNLSDPSLPLRQGVLQANLNAQNNQAANNQISYAAAPIPQIQNNPIPVMVQNSGANTQTAPPPTNQPVAIVRGSEMDNLVNGTDLGNMDSVMKPLFNGNLSVANMMAIIELVGEMFEEKGDDCIDLLVEQCKLMGLKAEDEHTIYNIIDMLKNSGMSVEESISQLYRFAKIVGLNDRAADAYYSRLIAHKKTGTKRDQSRSE
ncbi:MAG: hypothetical protein HW410_1066 [Nitrosarchaeum sp.]|nr:hypothetical protein [Nitrosarchaeum sp.]